MYILLQIDVITNIYIYIYINWQKQLFEDFFNGKKSIMNSVCQ